MPKSVGELTTIILCACSPIMPKFLQWITGKTKNKSTYHESAYTNGHNLKGGQNSSKRSNQLSISDPMASTNTAPWLDAEDHEFGLMGKTNKGNYHNLDVGQSYIAKPAPISKMQPSGPEGVPKNSIWKTNEVNVDSSLDPERGGHDFV